MQFGLYLYKNKCNDKDILSVYRPTFGAILKVEI